MRPLLGCSECQFGKLGVCVCVVCGVRAFAHACVCMYVCARLMRNAKEQNAGIKKRCAMLENLQ